MRKVIYKLLHPFFRVYWRTFKPKTYGSRAIITHENNILLVKNINVSYWLFPGGMMDAGENPEQCLLRELKEELNLSELNIGYKLVEYTSNREGKKDTIYIFIIKLISPVFQRQWELEDAQWFDLDNLPSNMSPAGLRRIKEYRAGDQNVLAEW